MILFIQLPLSESARAEERRGDFKIAKKERAKAQSSNKTRTIDRVLLLQPEIVPGAFLLSVT
jgi:hypothetical protein